MKILHVSHSDLDGGAARATYRIHRALAEHGMKFGLLSRMRVISKASDDPTVISGPPQRQANKWRRLRRSLSNRIRNRLNRRMRDGFCTGNSILHSNPWLDTGLGKELQERHASGSSDLLHLHWLGESTLSIEEIGDLPQPIVWTLHDQWAFCGAEHYTSPPGVGESASSDERFAEGYNPANRPRHESGPDLNRWTWDRKRRAWRLPMQIVCPSTWMADCARRSEVMGTWPITMIPYPIDLDLWAPWDQAQARSILNLPQDRPLVLFGAIAGTGDSRKGADLLLEALQLLKGSANGSALERLELVVFGQSSPADPPSHGFPIHFKGRLHDDISLRLLYAAADVFVIPSRQDNLPNTGLEAHACATPVVAFRTGGLVDIVDDRITGALAEPFDPASLAAAIAWVLEDPLRRCHLGAAARARAEQLWEQSRIAGLYAQVYREALS